MKINRKRVNIKQVAHEAGVSTQTISRVLNNRPDVAEETRRHVLEVISRLDYRPSALARSLIQQRSLTLGVVIAGLTYFGPSQTLNGITGRAEELGYSLLLKELSRFSQDDVEPILNSLLARQVDGIIWAVSDVGNNHDWLRNQAPHLSVPIVYLTMEPQADLTIVSVNNYRGGQLAATHLIEQGCRHIGHISGPLGWWESRQRKAGWAAVLQAAGLPLAERQCVEGNWSSESGAQAIEQLLAQFPDMDGVFVANDQMAIGVLQKAYRTGLRVPQDLAIIGFDNMDEGAYFWPPLSTVHHDLNKLGRRAVSTVVNLIEAAHKPDFVYKPEFICIEPQLIVRESSSLKLTSP
jgi:LacI family transcriptional regulator